MNPTQDEADVSKASVFAASLADNRIIKPSHNGSTFPIHQYKLSPVSLFRMFYNILHPLVSNIHSIDPIVIDVDVMTRSVAYDALVNTFAVLYHKGTSKSPALIPVLGKAPDLILYKLPVFVAELINSIGPVEIPAGRLHVPYLLFNEVVTQKPQYYNIIHTEVFIDQVFQLQSYAMLGVNIMSAESSPWWTFHSYSGRVHNNQQTYTLWSPIQWSDCDHSLKLGALFAKSRLTTCTGIVNFSCTPFYEVNYPPQSIDFPSEAMEFPYFIRSQPAYHGTYDRFPGADKIGPASHHSQASSTGFDDFSPGAAEHLQPATSGNTALPGIRRRELPHGSVAEAEADVARFRIIFCYFDHQAACNITDVDLDAWSTCLNAL